MNITLTTVINILQQAQLLREIISDDIWSYEVQQDKQELNFESLSYDTRTVTSSTLLFCKGNNFKASYLEQCNNELSAYVSEHEYSSTTNAVGIIVTNIKEAMGLIAAEFYDHPEHELTIIGITGTKGKTTTAYFTYALLSEATNHRTALFSSVDNIVDGVHGVESSLTTPESLDLFAMMDEARQHGMKYLVMEVSSQAYKTQRVAGIQFNIGVFTNISPDHIAPIEHPTFEDYFYCKRQLLQHCDSAIINANSDYFPILQETAKHYAKRIGIVDANLFIPNKQEVASQTDHDTKYLIQRAQAEMNTSHHPEQRVYRGHFSNVYSETLQQDTPDNAATSFAQYQFSTDTTVLPHTTTTSTSNSNFSCTSTELAPSFHLQLEGLFNYENALTALAIVDMLGLSISNSMITALSHITISGRMEHLESDDGIIAYVDYAHNGLSARALIDYIKTVYANTSTSLILVTGSVGDKALNRRREIVEAVQDAIQHLILTIEDTNLEDPANICKEMRGYVTNQNVNVATILDREEAIRHAVEIARHDMKSAKPIILCIGKGDEQWIKIHNKHVPYVSDPVALRNAFADKNNLS